MSAEFNPFERHQSKGSGKPVAMNGGSRPTAIPPNFNAIPAVLAERSNWVLWRYEPPDKPDKKWQKIPYQLNGRKALINKPRTWSPFQAVCAAYAQAQGEYDGIGFVFDGVVGPDGLCIAGIDFDHCVSANGDIDPLAQQRIDAIDTYKEPSVSGTGFHSIGYAEPLPPGRIVKFDGVEMYTRARFFTFTGQGQGTIKAIPKEFAALAAEIWAKQAAAAGSSGRSAKFKVIEGGLAPELCTNAERRETGLTSNKPASAFFEGYNPNESLGGGIQKNYWFDQLQPMQQDEVVDHALGIIAARTTMLELEADGGNNLDWYRMVTAVARSSAPHAEDILVKHASKAKNADDEDAIRQKFATCRDSAAPEHEGVTIGTLLGLAIANGADFEPWRRLVPNLPIAPPQLREPLKGGVYQQGEALELINSHFFMGTRERTGAGMYRINSDKTPIFISMEAFKLETANIFVPGADGKNVHVSTWWLNHRQRHERKIVFKPEGTDNPEEYNLWTGFAVEPRAGMDKVNSLLRHIWEVYCRGNGKEFDYFMNWHAWKIQNAGRAPEVRIFIKGEEQGSGKTTISDVMCLIFGKHAMRIADPEHLFGKFNPQLEYIVYVACEEMLWAGDHKTNDKMKHATTGRDIWVEIKNGPKFAIKNRLAFEHTTNHPHAVALGVKDRRVVVYEVDPKYVGNQVYFKVLWDDLNNGGVEQFLHLLQNYDLGEWHPRETIKTIGSIEQQRMSADLVIQWAQDCIDNDLISWPTAHGGEESHNDLGTWIASEYLFRSYVAFCKKLGMRAANPKVFGRGATRMFGPCHRCAGSAAAIWGARRPRGYDVPNWEAWQAKIDEMLGIAAPTDANG
jgi:hypothetical protein